MNFDGKAVVVTGGALGIGRGVSPTPGVLPPKEVRLPNMVVLPF